MGKFILLHRSENGEYVLVNMDSISMVLNNSDGGSILLLESQHRNCLNVSEPMAHIYAIARKE